MKVLFITQNLAPFRILWLESLSSCSSAEITVAYLGQYEARTQASYKNVTSKCLTLKNVGHRIGMIWLYHYGTVLKLADEADMVIVDGYGFLAQMILIPMLKRYKIKFVLSADGGIQPEQENKIKHNVKKHLISAADFYFSTCPEMDAILKYYGANEKNIFRHRFASINSAEIIKEPLNEAEKSARKRKLGLEDKPMVISVGKDPEGKGFDTLLYAIKAFPKQMQCYVIGASEADMNDFLSKIENDWKQYIHCIPYMDKKHLAEYYQASDLFVLPTRHDVWGLVIGEAMANGVSVITTDQCIAGINMLPKSQIIPVENEKELSIKMLEFLSDPEKRMKAEMQQLETIREYAYDVAAREDWKNLMRIYKMV